MQKPCRWHDAGNVGVEHAAPDAIQRAILAARLAQPRRAHFMRDDLVELHLIAEMGKSASKVGVSWVSFGWWADTSSGLPRQT